jgi:lysylphosphatidylglycerol synthetase-like protein (DUF2156 family)
MRKALITIAFIVLNLHGIVHLMGTAVYLKMGEVEGMGYKTTLLGGRWDLGEIGIGVIGVLWAAAALGFIAVALAIAAKWRWARPALLGVTLFSLALTILDWERAYAGAVINIAILAVLLITPYITRRSTR